ncbi:hypothetical protein LVJ94_31710 [Pendulispora rubella]|uniref:PepSY domain-containing protein n=1 Tax=Pendulispora rubella TaxID=2741070 RepID=A0ABZ2KS41_9BACT
MIRLLARVHRWLGVPMALLVFVWFVSGIVMALGGGFPEVTERDRLERGGPLPSLPEATAAEAFPAGVEATGSVRIVPRLGKPIWEIESARGIVQYDVASGVRLLPGTLSDTEARALARQWLGTEPETAVTVHAPDTWTPRAEAQGWLPMLRATAHDGAEVYVSLAKGRIVQHSTSRARVMAWFGAIPHWIYFVQVRRHAVFWKWLVIALSTLGACAAFSGIAVGIARAFRHWARHGQFGPFRKTAFAWHHGAGLTVGALVFTWLVSGALSLDPFALDAHGTVRAEERERARGGRFEPRAFTRSVRQAADACAPHLVVRSLELVQIVGEPFYVCRESPVRAMVLSASHEDAPLARLPAPWLDREVSALTGGEPSRVTELEAPDAYYYPTHFYPDMTFPVLKIESGAVVHYVDETTGRILRRHDGTSRTYRWLYHGFHSFDLPSLLAHPRIWYALILVLSLVGALVAATATWLAMARVRRFTSRR